MGKLLRLQDRLAEPDQPFPMVGQMRGQKSRLVCNLLHCSLALAAHKARYGQATRAKTHAKTHAIQDVQVV